eukprot:scaffold810_cov127-Skeletonema_marinoi.AAC.1
MDSKPPRNYNEDLVNMINDLKKRKVICTFFALGVSLTLSYYVSPKHLFVVPPTPARLPHQDAVGREIEIESRKRDEVQSRIDEEKMRLMHCETRLSKLQSSNEAYAKMVKEAEAAYKKIEESSQTLLHVMKREQIKQIWIDKFARVDTLYLYANMLLDINLYQ